MVGSNHCVVNDHSPATGDTGPLQSLKGRGGVITTLCLRDTILLQLTEQLLDIMGFKGRSRPPNLVFAKDPSEQ